MITNEERDRALARYCPMCRAPRGEPCKSLVDGQALPQRDVHLYRIR